MNRREFLQTACAAGAAAMVDVPLLAQNGGLALEKAFQNPPEDAGLSIVYHWTGGAVTKEGITADMEGIASSGIRIVNWFYFDGAAPTNAEGIPTPACLTPEWWGYVEHLMSEAKRLDLIVAPHICSSWGPAGAPGITPELSQQQLVWSEVQADGGQPFKAPLPRPERSAAAGRGRGGGPSFPAAWQRYYRDVAVLAFPIPADWGETSVTRGARVTTNLPVQDPARAADPDNNERVVITDKAGWIQFAFDRPFTLRAVTMNPGVAPAGGAAGQGFGAGLSGPNPYRIAHSLAVEASDDGKAFRTIGQLNPMGNGWQTRNLSVLTHTVSETTARYFRLVYTPGPPLGYDEGMRTGTRTGGGDFKNMIEPLAFASVVLSSTPAVHHLPCKNMTTWGWSRLATDEETPPSACVPLGTIVDLTNRLQEDGTIAEWTPDPGRWKVLRIGCTSQMTSTGGGLHADKLSREAARVVFNGWFGQFRKRIPRSAEFIKVYNIDSWEGGSQNWSPLLPDEFRSRRGYDLTKYLPCMTGVMVESARTTEGFLLDLRRTISECIADNFYGESYRLAHENGAILMSEDVNPAVAVDGMQYYKNTDWVGSEFWVRAGQNWKPNDVRDATAAARMYGKKVNFSEAFTGGGWQDHPFALKAMGDHNYTQGINRLMLHVWNEQYRPGRAPGIPGAGTPFNHLNTWWKAAQPWREYLKKTQAVLQNGRPVLDALYFAGENIPCRSLLPPEHGVCWYTDPALPKGYAHDTINRDGLLNLATVEDGRIAVNGIRYRVLVLRASERFLTPSVARRIRSLVEAGAIVVGPRPLYSPSLEEGAAGQAVVRQVADQLWGTLDGRSVTENRFGKGRVIWGKPMADVLASLGVPPDVQFTNMVETATGKPVVVNASAPGGTNPVAVGPDRKGWGIEYLHHQGPGFDYYFLSNQEFFGVSCEVSLRISGRVPELWYADTGRTVEAPAWREQGGRTIIPIDFDPAGAVFVVLRRPLAGVKAQPGGAATAGAAKVPPPIAITGAWSVTLPLRGADKRLELQPGSWTDHAEDEVKFFSGTATYRKEVTIPAAYKAAGRRLLLDLGEVRDLARVRVNGKDLGVLWKAPYVADITPVATVGVNRLELEATNTWVNRLAGDAGKPENERVTYLVQGGFGRTGAPLQPLPSGLIGPVRIACDATVEARRRSS